MEGLTQTDESCFIFAAYAGMRTGFPASLVTKEINIVCGHLRMRLRKAAQKGESTPLAN